MATGHSNRMDDVLGELFNILKHAGKEFDNAIRAEESERVREDISNPRKRSNATPFAYNDHYVEKKEAGKLASPQKIGTFSNGYDPHQPSPYYHCTSAQPEVRLVESEIHRESDFVRLRAQAGISTERCNYEDTLLLETVSQKFTVLPQPLETWLDSVLDWVDELDMESHFAFIYTYIDRCILFIDAHEIPNLWGFTELFREASDCSDAPHTTDSVSAFPPKTSKLHGIDAKQCFGSLENHELTEIILCGASRFYLILTYIVEILAHLFGAGQLNEEATGNAPNYGGLALQEFLLNEEFSRFWDEQLRNALRSFLSRVWCLIDTARPANAFQIVQRFWGEQLHKYYHIYFDDFFNNRFARNKFDKRSFEECDNCSLNNCQCRTFCSQWHCTVAQEFKHSWVGMAQRSMFYDSMKEYFEEGFECIAASKGSRKSNGAECIEAGTAACTVKSVSSYHQRGRQDEMEHISTSNYPCYPKIADREDYDKNWNECSGKGAESVERHFAGESETQAVQDSTRALLGAMCNYHALFPEGSDYHHTSKVQTKAKIPSALGKENRAKNPEANNKFDRKYTLQRASAETRTFKSYKPGRPTQAYSVIGTSSTFTYANSCIGTTIWGKNWDRLSNDRNCAIKSCIQQYRAQDKKHSSKMAVAISRILPYLYGRGVGPRNLNSDTLRLPQDLIHMPVLGDIFTALGQRKLWKETLESCLTQRMEYLLEYHCESKLTSPQLAPLITVFSSFLPFIQTSCGLNDMLYIQDSLKVDFAVSIYTRNPKFSDSFLNQAAQLFNLVDEAQCKHDFVTLCGKLLIFISEKFGMIRVTQLISILCNCPTTIAALMDLKACEFHLHECEASGLIALKLKKEFIATQMQKQLVNYINHGEPETIPLILLSLNVLMFLRHFHLDEAFVENTLNELKSLLKARKDLDEALFQKLGIILLEEEKLNVRGLYKDAKNTPRASQSRNSINRLDASLVTELDVSTICRQKYPPSKESKVHSNHGVLWFFIDALGTAENLASRYEMYLARKYLSNAWHRREARFLRAAHSETQLVDGNYRQEYVGSEYEADKLEEDAVHVRYLQSRLGHDLMGKLNIIIDDMRASINFENLFMELLSSKEDERGIEVYTSICSSGYWPENVINLNSDAEQILSTLPPFLDNIVKMHKNFHAKTECERILEYRFEESNVEIEASGKLILLPFVEAAILLAVEQAEEFYQSLRPFSLTTQEIARLLGASHASIQRYVKSLESKSLLCMITNYEGEDSYGFVDISGECANSSSFNYTALPSPMSNMQMEYTNGGRPRRLPRMLRNYENPEKNSATSLEGCIVAADVNLLDKNSNALVDGVGNLMHGMVRNASATACPVIGFGTQDTAEEADIDLNTVQFRKPNETNDDAVVSQLQEESTALTENELEARLRGYENAVLCIIKHRAEKLAQATVDTQARATPTGVILGRLNKVLEQKKQETLKHSDVLAILNWMESKKLICRKCGNWEAA